MRERTLRISSAGKTFSCTGWKIGWVSGPAHAGLGGAAGQAVPDLRQRRAVAAGGGGRAGPAGRVLHRLPGHCRPSGTCSRPGSPSAGFGVLAPEGTYFVTADITPLGGTDGVEFCRSCRSGPAWWRCPRRSSTTTEAGRRLVRFAFCKRTEVLAEASPGCAAATEVARAAGARGAQPVAANLVGDAVGDRLGRSTVGASTITRTSGSVPDGRSSTRPVSPSSASARRPRPARPARAAPAAGPPPGR